LPVWGRPGFFPLCENAVSIGGLESPHPDFPLIYHLSSIIYYAFIIYALTMNPERLKLL